MKESFKKSWLLAVLILAIIAGPSLYGKISIFWLAPAVLFLVFTVYHNLKR